MLQNDILNALPSEAQDIVKIVEAKDRFKISHPYLDNQDLFNKIREAIEALGGKYGGYYAGAAHYEILKNVEGVTPQVVTMDKSKPPELGMDSEATYKDVRNGFPEEVGVKLVAVDKLVASPWWPREKAEDLELVESVKKHGVRQNLEARPRKDGKLELVYGHRRFYAALKAGLKVVPVKIRDLTDEEALLVQFEENDKQKQWSAVETMRYLKTMMEKLRCKTQKELAQKIGKNESWISRYMQIEKIAPGQFPIETGELTERQARELLKAPEEKRKEILEEAEKTGEIPSARKIERIISPELRKCDKCHVASSDVQEWNNHGIYLCQTHMQDATKHPEKYLGLKRTAETVKKMEKPKVEKPLETWEQRKARMHPQHSKIEIALLEKLRLEKIGPVAMDRKFCLQSTTPDFYFPQKHLAVYLDGAVHQGREDRDQKLRDLLKKRQGVAVLSIPCKNMSNREVERVFNIIKEVQKRD